MIRRPSQPWPWNTIPTPRPADWGVGMTVCIAGICEEDGGAIVTASDRMVSMGGVVSGDDAARKLDPIRRNWTALLAGNDISPAVPIISRIRAAPRLSAGETLTNVATLVKTAFRDQRLEQIEDEVLGAYGWDWQSFRKEAPTLAASVYERIQLEIHDYALSLEFLVAGFDPDGEAHIFTVSNPGRCEYFDKVGFWAIGSGQQQAVSSLFFTEYSRHNDLANCVLRILCAKFAAESAMGVGQSTWVVITKCNVVRLIVIDRVLQLKIKTAWREMPKLPNRILGSLAKDIAEQQKDIELDPTEGGLLPALPQGSESQK